MAYNKNLNINSNNVVNISGSKITLTGSLFGAEISGTTAEFTTVSASVVSASTYYGLNLTASVITGSELNIDYIDFVPQQNEPDWQLGRVFYDGSGSLAAYTDIEDIKINLGQELMLRVHNETGSPIAKGKVVRLTSTLTSTDTPRIVTASWDDDSSSATTLGVVVKNINDSEEGYIILNGILPGIDLTLTASTAGQMLYLSSSGDLTTTKPVQPKHEVRVAQAVRVTSNGSMFVRVQNGYELDELHDVLITSASNGDLLVYNSGSGLWNNSKTLNGSYTVSGNLTVTGSTTVSSLTGSGASNNIFISGSLSGMIAAITSSSDSTYVLTAADSGKVIVLSSSSGMTASVGSGLPAGFTTTIVQNGTGSILISSGSGVTIRNRQGHTRTAGLYAVVTLIGTGSDGYIFAGDTTT